MPIFLFVAVALSITIALPRPRRWLLASLRVLKARANERQWYRSFTASVQPHAAVARTWLSARFRPAARILRQRSMSILDRLLLGLGDTKLADATRALAEQSALKASTFPSDTRGMRALGEQCFAQAVTAYTALSAATAFDDVRGDRATLFAACRLLGRLANLSRAAAILEAQIWRQLEHDIQQIGAVAGGFAADAEGAEWEAPSPAPGSLPELLPTLRRSLGDPERSSKNAADIAQWLGTLMLWCTHFEILTAIDDPEFEEGDGTPTRVKGDEVALSSAAGGN